MTDAPATKAAAYLLPDDWELTSIGTHYVFKNGLNKAKRFFGKGTPIINYMDVFRNQRLGASDVQGKVTVSNDEADAYSALQGDVFFTRTSETVTEIGYSAVLLEPIQHAVFSGFVLRGRPKTKELTPEFAAYALRARGVRKQIESRATYTTRALTNGGSLSECTFPLPREQEQKAIAQALCDIDDLIASLDALIAKKRDIKQGAMQHLLTGKRRLNGFSEEWALVQLGSIAKLYQSETIAQSKFTQAGFPVYGANGVIGYFDKSNHHTPQITLSCRGNCGTINITSGPSWITGNAMVVNVDHNPLVNQRFLYHFLREFDFSTVVTGSGQPQIVKGPLSEIELCLPTEKAEQAAIAEVFDEFDSDLTALVHKKTKVSDLRQGMMQQLLTGRVRLK